jgi:plastocyanin
MFKQMKVWLALTTIFSLIALVSSCGNKTATNEGTTNDSPTTGKAFTPGAGSIAGTIAYNGTPPAPKKIATDADPVCGQANPNLSTEDNIVKDGKLANVFVYVKDGTTADGTKVGDYTYTTPSEAVNLDQHGCHYVPHVMGIQVNQKLKIVNSDPTQHNIHPTPKVNEEWNQTQPNGAAPIEKTFKRAEVLIPVKCNQHPWMKAYIGVLKHPFFAVSGEDGSYTIKGLPAGTYTVVAWHEGGANGTEKTMSVTVPATGAAKADFAFGEAATAASRPSLEMMPALDVPMIGRH